MNWKNPFKTTILHS